MIMKEENLRLLNTHSGLQKQSLTCRCLLPNLHQSQPQIHQKVIR